MSYHEMYEPNIALYYMVQTAVGENFMHTFMHLQLHGYIIHYMYKLYH